MFKTIEGDVGLVVALRPAGDYTLYAWVDFYTSCGGDAGAEEQEIRVGGEPALWCPLDQVNQPNPSAYLMWQGSIIEIFAVLAGSGEGVPI